MSAWLPGQVVEVDYPFVLSVFRGYGDERETWTPGVRYVYVSPYGDSDSVFDGMGKQILTVVSTHKPGRFPERVFFERRWVTPAGKTFGKSKCHIETAQKFSRLARGFQHECRAATDSEIEKYRAELNKKGEAA